ncbi:hypothetical protein [Flagellimonas eckloniae]|uniref:Uncharacterized protein n=1 Tax=Flagellimonas eckloniae TaxID=346185 RepID=A0A0Q0WXU6_9FLAO|nr:hypothetical protein [Allomuricauda eckloniae]KQC30317.1 hypothetical protein AAY42_10825 [Allomuricauda eckloniae]
MNIINAIEQNLGLFMKGVKPFILKDNENEITEFHFSIDELGFDFQFVLKNAAKPIVIEISIKPKHNSLNDNSLILTNGNELSVFLENTLGREVCIEKISIEGFIQPRSNLTNITAEGDGSFKNLNIDNTESHSVEIKNLDRVNIRQGIFAVVGIQNVNNINLGTISGRSDTNKISIQSGKVSELIINELKGKIELNFIELLDGKIMNSNIKSFKSNLTSFDTIEYFNNKIDVLEIKEPNTSGGKGEIKFHKTQVKDLILFNMIVDGLQEFKIFKSSFLSKKRQVKKQVSFYVEDSNFRPEKIDVTEVEWNYRGLKMSPDYPEGKRRFINMLKNYYQENDDVLNTQLMNSFERKWYFQNYKKSFPLRMASISNNFGLSITKPLLWILFLILIQCIILLSLSGDCYPHLIEKWGVFFNLINPAHKTSVFLDVFDGRCTPNLLYENILYALDNLNRILIGYFIFQFASAFRYKYRLK